MSMKIRTLSLAAILAAATVWSAVAFAQAPATQAPSDPSKQTTLGKYCTSLEAYLMWRSKPKEVTILDVRTPEEYSFVGHAEMALNIPVKFFNAKFDAAKKTYGMDVNKDFVAQVSKRLGKNDTILVMCRNGQRTPVAVNLLAKDGFTNVYSVMDSFEGDMVSDPESVFNGKFMKNGWKNYGLPWTYSLNPDLVWSK